ncbi:MAG: hypothetical protein EOP83_14490 [Verrucomicrobiaceae bacterium]|nr:MAG: hypothetical protein EOP83_14490 [Verrucomicrobiaceae bacterium]
MAKYLNATNAQNRFSLCIENLVSKLHGTSGPVEDAVYSAKVDYTAKTITFKVADIQGGITERFFDHLEEDPILNVRLRMYRHGMQEIDYTKRFHGGRMVSRSIDLTYDAPGMAMHHCVLEFDTSEVESFLAS